MDDDVHPRMRARIEAVERSRAVDAEYELYRQLDEVESLALAVDGLSGSDLAESVADACARFRRTLASHGPATPAGRMFRKFLPDRLRELRDDCEATRRFVERPGA